MSRSVYVVGDDRQVAKMFFDRNYSIINRIDKADIVCFIGGADLHPSLYDQGINKEANVSFNEKADKRDIQAWSDTNPSQFLVGICRGGQFLNVINNGSLYQHVSGHRTPHMMYDTLFGEEVQTSSCHHQMMIPAKDAEIIAYTEDHGFSFTGEDKVLERPQIEPEVVWYQKTKSLCFQGHPEWYSPASTKDYFFKVLEKLYG